MTRSCRPVRKNRPRILENLLEAQKIAFAPFIFEACASALSSGLLAALSHAPEGLTEEALQSETKLSSYAVRVLLDLLAPAGVVERVKSANAESAEAPLLWRATPVADLLLFDDMTRANFFFTKDVNYEALGKLDASLAEGRPAGLAAFDSSWKTIYPHLPELPEAARKAWREQFDLASARAVAALPMLAEYCLPLVKVGGSFLAMKGSSGEEELAAARGAIRKLGGEYKETRTLHLPGGDTRTLILCKKISQTPTAYPRNGGKIAKSPLK